MAKEDVTPEERPIPEKNKIEKAAQLLSSIMPSGRRVVYLIGAGGQGDWNAGIGKTYRDYLEGLYEVPVAQNDNASPGGYRSLRRSTGLKVEGAIAGLIFDTSAKGFRFTSNDRKIPTSYGQMGAWIDVLRIPDFPNPYQMFSSVTYDHIGVSTVPIEHLYRENDMRYIGPRNFVLLNIVSQEEANKAMQDRDFKRLETQLKAGKIEPTRLRTYEEHLRKRGTLDDKRRLEDIVIPNLDRIFEPDMKSGFDIGGTVSSLVQGIVHRTEERNREDGMISKRNIA